MLVTAFILWASLLTGAWPATPIQDQLPATPRVRLSFKGKGLLRSSLKPSFLTVLVSLQREEEWSVQTDCSRLGFPRQARGGKQALLGKVGALRTEIF